MREKKKEKVRFNMLLDKDLKNFAKEHAYRNGISVTHLIENCLRELRAKQSRQL